MRGQVNGDHSAGQ